MSLLLVVDDDPAVIAIFEHMFKGSQIEIASAVSVTQGLTVMQARSPDAVLLDVSLPDGRRMIGLQRFLTADPQMPVVIMTDGSNSDVAIEAMQSGAMDYLTKPLEVNELNKIVRRAIEIRRMIAEAVELETASPNSGSAIIGRCSEMQKVYKSIGRIAAQNISVLIRGESGTGKELVARAIFQFSPRKDKPFLAVNCAAIPDALLESELFGHERGAFTGADRKRIGKFEQCNGGTLFLDEIGDMDSQLQSKLLRVLQEKQFERVGGNETITSDVRVVAATHRDLEKMCSVGMFREDLFYRLNGFTIQLPPLRERGGDLALLIEFFRTQANQELNKFIQRVDSKAMEILASHSWPGNIRELQSVIRQSIIQSSGPVLLADFLPDGLNAAVSADRAAADCVGVAGTSPAGATAIGTEPQLESVQALIQRHRTNLTPTLYDDVLEEVERQLIAAVLDDASGNQSEAAKKLGITRTTIRSKINKLGIGIKRIVE